MILHKVRDALLTVGVGVYHFSPPKDVTGAYVVWAEDSAAESIWADGGLSGQVLQGTIDYYTQVEYDIAVEQIQQALADAGISFKLNSIQHEDETGYIHYEWVFEVV